MAEVIIKQFITHDRTFTIVKQNEYYLAIEDKYITDGKTNTALNGLQMHASRELDECLEDTRRDVLMDVYMRRGFTKAEAFCLVHECPEMLETLRTLLD